MADHNKPTTTSLYTDVLTELDGRLDDIALGFDPANTSATNVPTNAIRWTSASNKWQKWNGSAWSDLSSGYSININGTVGATTPAAGTFTTLASTGNTTLGDASGDSVTINAATVSTPNGLNFDSNTLVIDAANNRVGVGTSSPSEKLTLGAAGKIQVLRSDNARGGEFFADNTGTHLTALASGSDPLFIESLGASGQIRFTTGGTERMRIDSSGNVGIGTSSPSSYSATTSPALTVLGSVSGANGLINAWDSTTGGAAGVGGNITFGGNDGVTATRAFANIKGGKENSTSGNYASYLSFSTRANGGATTERIRIDSSGNVGINTDTPAARLEISGGNAGVTDPLLSPNRLRFTDSDTTKANNQVTGGIEWYTADTDAAGVYAYISSATNSAGSGYVTFATGSSSTIAERMRIDSSGNVGIGTSGPAVLLHVYKTTGRNDYRIASGSSSGEVASVQFYGTDSGAAAQNYAQIIGGVTTNTAGSEAGYLSFETVGSGSVSERMRIDSSGNLLVGQSSSNFDSTTLLGNGVGISGNFSNTNGLVVRSTNTTSTQYLVQFVRGTSACGSITSTTTNSTTYATSSDYRLKENIAPMSGALEKVSQLKPCIYTWKTDGSAGQGFIAHELQAVVPECVVGEKDAVETYTDEEGNEQTRPVYQGVDTSFLVATLTAAIQELKAENDTLKSRLDAAGL